MVKEVLALRFHAVFRMGASMYSERIIRGFATGRANEQEW